MINDNIRLVAAESFEIFNTAHDMLMVDLETFWPTNTDPLVNYGNRIEHLGAKFLELTSGGVYTNRSQIEEVLHETAILALAAVLGVRGHERREA